MIRWMVFALLVGLSSGCSSVSHGVRVPVYQIPFMILENEPAPPAIPEADAEFDPPIET